jgi:hypothetical protein
MIRYWHSGALSVGTFLLLALTPVGAADPPGDLWQTTSQMAMEGMPMAMPANTLKLCTAREWTRPPPPPPGQTCTQSNFQRSGNKVSWDQTCTGQMETTGHGEITFDSADSYTGSIKTTAEGMTMTIRLSGKKLGTCDNPVS